MIIDCFLNSQLGQENVPLHWTMVVIDCFISYALPIILAYVINLLIVKYISKERLRGKIHLVFLRGIMIAVIWGVAFFTIAMFVIKWYGGRGGFLYFYNCPIVIVSALHLLLFFSKISLRSRLINWVAVSAFAIIFLSAGMEASRVFLEA